MRSLLSGQSSSGWILNILPGILEELEVCVKHGCLSLAMEPFQREINLFHQLGVDLNLGSSASLGWRLWTPLTSLSFSFSCGENRGQYLYFRVAFCEPKYVSDVWPKPGSHGRNAMAVIIVINPVSRWFTVTSKLEMQILGEGTSYCGLVFSGKTSPEIASDEEFLGGLVVKTQSFHCRRLGFDPWSGNSDPTGSAEKK